MPRILAYMRAKQVKIFYYFCGLGVDGRIQCDMRLEEQCAWGLINHLSMHLGCTDQLRIKLNLVCQFGILCTVSEQTASKLNQLEQELPEGLLVDAAWLERRGYYGSLRKKYVDLGWLEQPAYRRRPDRTRAARLCPFPRARTERSPSLWPQDATCVAAQTSALRALRLS